ncbi:hypothetical protein DLAC_02265 [Tieghemostelium lacteum]|uniref:Uncharacterized protein n=1 Tax=Tieghemostelium lacteum TaxID=361077 RepID=A0A152A4J6_TIELA|nr:hypothetical protein DLAC_02265 [Tieghemostelium lacteum]|eukprot:KYR01156.1 hypothetical protein DLAC_02265 [Tieghemostelium lacteum]
MLILERSLIALIINLWIGFGKKSSTNFKYTVNILAKLRLVSKEFTVNIIPLLDWGEIRIESKNDMKILNKLYNPKPKLDRLYISCQEEEIIRKFPSWVIYLSETQPKVGINYPIVAHQLINKNRLKSLLWEYNANHNITNLNCNNLIKLIYMGSKDISVDLSVISTSFLNLVELTIRGFGVIQNMNSLGQLEHLKMITLSSGTCIIGSFIELLERKQCSIETIKFLNIKFTRSIDQDANLVEHFDNILDVLSNNSYLKELLIKNDVSPVSKQSLIKFLNSNKTLTKLTIENCKLIVDANIIYQPITNTTLKYFYYSLPNNVIGSMLLNEWNGTSALENPCYSPTNNIPLISKGNHPNINVYYYDCSQDNLNNLIDILKLTYKGIKNVWLHIEDNDMVAEVLEILKEYLPSNNEINTINLENGLEIAIYLIQLNHPSIKELTVDLFNPINQDIAINLLKSICTNHNHIQNISPRFELNSLNLAEFIDTITEIIENNHNIYCIELFLSVPMDSIINTANLNHSFERFEKAISKFYHYLDFINITILQGPMGKEHLLKPFYNILCKYSILNDINMLLFCNYSF